MDPTKVLIIDEARDVNPNLHELAGREPKMAEKLLEAGRFDYDAIGRSMMTYEESALSKKREYWWNRAMAPHLKEQARHEKAMGKLVCPLCMDDKTTRSRAHLGPFIKRGDGMIHDPAKCPHQNGEIVKLVDKP